jgi:alpha-beta hydrolase superfamily lysophospholipase
MRNVPLFGVFLGAVLAAGAGCARNDSARGLLTVSTGAFKSPGQTDQEVMAFPGKYAGEAMVKQGRIDLWARVEMPDKTPIDAWAIKHRSPRDRSAPAAGTALILHAMRYGKGSYPYFGVAERLARRGFDVVLVDLRGHGQSGGEFCTFGVKERDDLKRVMDNFIAEHGVSDKVYVFGAGLGACVGIQYAAIDSRARGVLAVAPYKDFRSYARQQNPLMTEADFQKLLDSAGRLGGFRPEDASAVEAAKRLACPLMVVHGILDFTVPLEWSQAVAESAGGPKNLNVVSLGTPIVAALYEDWIAEQVETLARNGLKEPSPQTQPAATTSPVEK